MSIRMNLMSLLVAVALVGGACSSGDGEATATTGGVSPDETSTTGAADDEMTDQGSPDPSDDGDSDSVAAPVGDKESGEGETPDTGSGGDGPDPVDDPEAALAEFVGGEVPVEVEKCVVVGILDDPDLRAATLGMSPSADFSDLELDDQLALLELSVDCAGSDLFAEFMAEGFSEASGTVAPEGMAECFADQFEGPDGTLVMAGLVALGNDTPAGPKVRGPIIGALTQCVPASFIADAALDEMLTDPTFAAAVDSDCIVAAYEESTSIEPLWAAFVDDPMAEFAELPPEVTISVFGPLFNCISFGAVVAAEAAKDDVELSPETIACIDEELAGTGLFEGILAGEEPDAETLGTAVLGCLSSEELVQMAG